MHMDMADILLTDPAANAMEPFAREGRRFVFSHLNGRVPPLTEGAPVWAFVDWVLPDLSGLEMCRRLRAMPRTALAHITMVLETNDIEQGRRALAAGADDYMVGPAERQRVLERVLAVEPQVQQHRSGERLVVGELSIDMTALQARWAGRPVPLPPNEFRLLRFLAENPNRVLSRSELIDGLGKQDPPLDARTVDVWIGRLRRAFRAAGAGNPLRTVRSAGYVFDTP